MASAGIASARAARLGGGGVQSAGKFATKDSFSTLVIRVIYIFIFRMYMFRSSNPYLVSY